MAIAVFSARRRALTAAVLIGLLALGLRLLYLGEIAQSPLFAVPVIDAKIYAEDALYLSSQSWAGRPAPFWQPPLYPYALALLFRLCGENYYLPRLFQALLGAAICVLTYLLGRQVFSPAVALGAGLATAIYGPLIYFGGELLPPILAIFLDLLFLLSLPIPATGRSWRWVVSGALLGLAALAVANTLLFLPFLLLWLWQTHQSAQIPRSRTVQQSLLLLLGCGLAIAPVTLRNYLIGRDRVLISHNAGINFYIGNNPDYDRTVHLRPGREWALLVEKPEIEAGIERPSEKSRYFFARSWDFITADPLGYAQLSLRKLYLFWHGDEILRNLDPYYARNYSLLLRVLLWKHGLAFPFGMVAPLALLGLAAFWRAPAGRTPQGRLLVSFLLAYMLSVVLFFVTSRYRLPAVPFLLLFAACGVQQCLRASRRPAVLAGLLLLGGLSNWRVGAMDMEGDAHQHFYLGYAYEQKGMPAHALREYQAALQRRPDHEEALLNLAALYSEQGQDREAIERYQQFLRFYPDAVPVRFLLANACLRARRYEEAIAVYEGLVPQRPQWADLFGRLGYAYLMAERPEQATAAYRQALALRPDSTQVRYQLARLYQTRGQLDSALAEYRTLLEQEPALAEYHFHLADLLIEQEEVGKRTIYLDQTSRTRAAEEHLRLALRLAPDSLHALWSLGALVARQKRYVEAIELFERILASSPQDYQAHLFLGHLYQRTGRPQEAEMHFARYTRVEHEKQFQSLAQTASAKQLARMLHR